MHKMEPNRKMKLNFCVISYVLLSFVTPFTFFVSAADAAAAAVLLRRDTDATP